MTMNILFCDMGSFTYKDIYSTLIEKGHCVSTLYYHFSNKYEDEFFSERLRNEVRLGKFDVVFSVNFFPVIAVVCNDLGVTYLSWSYDSPLEEGFEQYFKYDTNRIILFDRVETEYYQARGHNNVFHLPLAVNVKRLGEFSKNFKRTNTKTDISFVGTLYRPYLDDLLAFADDYSRGYVEALFQSQLSLYGVNVIEQNLTDEIMERINNYNAQSGRQECIINKRGMAYAINRSITHSERVFLLNELSAMFKVDYYGYDGNYLENTVSKHGPVKYFTSMNEVFLNSTLNLCPTLRSISSGIPLRALDIVGCGATLFSNFQPELAEFFEDGKNVIMYTSIDDAFDKAAYYVKNPDVCDEIGRKGRVVAEASFRYSDRMDFVLSKVRI